MSKSKFRILFSRVKKQIILTYIQRRAPLPSTSCSPSTLSKQYPHISAAAVCKERKEWKEWAEGFHDSFDLCLGMLIGTAGKYREAGMKHIIHGGVVFLKRDRIFILTVS